MSTSIPPNSNQDEPIINPDLNVIFRESVEDVVLIAVMGVIGSGKTTVSESRALASKGRENSNDFIPS
jgi:Ni2+-binding GTPase involved in maturation of urease and hydrogenase